MRALFFSDPHFTDREQDAYRWKVFPFLHHVEALYGEIDLLACLGDLTDHKDCHSSALLHRVAKELVDAPGLSKIILTGNHDYIDPKEPFFDFLGRLKPAHIDYCGEPRLFEGVMLVLPHTRNPERDWAECRKHDEDLKLVLVHATVEGCQSEMGMILPGLKRTDIPGRKALILSGDIHKPQHLGPDFIYVGTPYSTRFSPFYEPRVLLLEWDPGAPRFDPKITSIPTGLKRKITHTISLAEAEACGGLPTILPLLTSEDELRISVRIPQHFPPARWRELKASLLEQWSSYPTSVSIIPAMEKLEIIENQTTVSRTTPKESLSEYCKANAITDSLATVGQDLLRRRLQST